MPCSEKCGDQQGMASTVLRIVYSLMRNELQIDNSEITAMNDAHTYDGNVMWGNHTQCQMATSCTDSILGKKI